MIKADKKVVEWKLQYLVSGVRLEKLRFGVIHKKVGHLFSIGQSVWFKKKFRRTLTDGQDWVWIR